jgi:hypothetical protein
VHRVDLVAIAGYGGGCYAGVCVREGLGAGGWLNRGVQVESVILIVTYNIGAMLVTMVLRIAMLTGNGGFGGPPGFFVGGGGMLRNAGREVRKPEAG